MAGSPYATLAGVLKDDLSSARSAFFFHTSRHRCPAGTCGVRKALDDLIKKISEELERETA
jgi:hypothetical protein